MQNICPPLLSDAVFTDCVLNDSPFRLLMHRIMNSLNGLVFNALLSYFLVEYLKIEKVNPMTADVSATSCIWIATSKLDYNNRASKIGLLYSYYLKLTVIYREDKVFAIIKI